MQTKWLPCFEQSLLTWKLDGVTSSTEENVGVGVVVGKDTVVGAACEVGAGSRVGGVVAVDANIGVNA